MMIYDIIFFTLIIAMIVIYLFLFNDNNDNKYHDIPTLITSLDDDGDNESFVIQKDNLTQIDNDKYIFIDNYNKNEKEKLPWDDNEYNCSKNFDINELMATCSLKKRPIILY